MVQDSSRGEARYQALSDRSLTVLPKYFSFALFGFAAASSAQNIPAEFVHDRISVVASASDGRTLKFYTDTGGGWNAIGASVADRLKLSATGEVEIEGARAPLVDFPDFLWQAGVPPPSDESWLKGRLVVAPDAMLMGADGFLGSRWFAGHIWQIDYPGQRLATVSAWKPLVDDHPAALGFRSGPDRRRVFKFPRVTISVDVTSIHAPSSLTCAVV